MFLKLPWTDFKSAAVANSLSVQYVTIGENYYLYAANGSFELHAIILKTTPANADQLDFETNYKPSANKPIATQQSSFSSKTFGGKQLYARNTGMQFALSQGVNVCSYTATYPWVKLVGAEIINGEALDHLDFEVYDTPAGTFSGVPNAKLNQFGFSVNVAPGYYKRQTPYDADVYYGMVLKMTYNSVSQKTIGLNLIMNEVKA